MSTHVPNLRLAQQLAQAGRFPEMHGLCEGILQTHGADLAALLDTGALLHAFGFLTHAQQAFTRAQATAPQDLRAPINLANVLRDLGAHHEARELYNALALQLPDHPLLRRNLLMGLEYDPEVSDDERKQQADAWGEWAIRRAGGERARPQNPPLKGRPLRVGYVSADLCQHTVGLFVKDVIRAHDRETVTPYAYSAGALHDWVTEEVRHVATFRDVRQMDDAALAARIRADGIDVLIDLSGHTAGSRLTAFAHRPAPIMVSWLGYFASTGLRYLDAVMLDEWHAPQGMEDQFIEPILRLSGGRFCYQPVPWAPAEVAPPPCLRNGFVTFGCFNNTSKLNKLVLDLWAKVLHQVPGSRLILKWRSFNDEAFRRQIESEFSARGIASERLTLRGPSFHAELLKEYADVDIALDPFPFTGGLTSCEALWMGVPVVTWPQSRAVSRQTLAFLCAIGLPELAAQCGDDYVNIAVQLAGNADRLRALREGLRGRMQTSSLMNPQEFCRGFEAALHRLANAV